MSNLPLFRLDLGGAKIEGVVLKSRMDPDPICRLRIPTGADLGYQHIVDQVAKMVEMLQAETGLKAEHLGIGHPGTLDPNTGMIKNANTTVLNNQPFNKDLEARLGIPVRLANDANCFAVAEAMMGAVPELCTQCRGRFYTSLSGQKRSLREIVTRSETNEDQAAIQTMDRLLHFFGKAMAVVINIMDPDAIVLGGGVGNIDRLYTDGPAEVQKHLFNHRIDTLFLRPKLGDSAGVFGAALR
jgi:fructokinase